MKVETEKGMPNFKNSTKYEKSPTPLQLNLHLLL